MSQQLERRLLTANIELRGAGKATKLTGYAARFNSPSEDLGGFTEYLAPGCFRDALANPSLNTVMLFNHDSNLVLGRVPDTLTLTEDSEGLYFQCTPPDTSIARDVLELVRQKVVTQCSFGFTIAPGGETWYDSSGSVVSSWAGNRRVITQVSRLYDTSVVTWPAYAETSVSARNAFLFPSGKPTPSGAESVRLAAKQRLLRQRLAETINTEKAKRSALDFVVKTRKQYL